MNILDIILISLSLSMDAFAVSLSRGLSNNKNNLLIAFLFGLFQSIMPLLGYSLSINFNNYIKLIDHWIIFILLLFIAIKMFLDAFNDNNYTINKNDLNAIIMMSFCVSIDAFAIGITFSLVKVNLLLSISIIGIITFLMSLLGLKIGNITSNYLGIKSQILGGFILLVMAFKILFEHLNII